MAHSNDINLFAVVPPAPGTREVKWRLVLFAQVPQLFKTGPRKHRADMRGNEVFANLAHHILSVSHFYLATEWVDKYKPERHKIVAEKV